MAFVQNIQNKLKGAVRKAYKRTCSRGLILMYHSVGDELPDPWSIRVTPKYFEEHLEVLKRLSKSMAFSNFAKANQEKTLEHGSVAVTFDDGYANNLHRAKPLLEKYEIPGTVFVASDFVKEGKHYWWGGSGGLHRRTNTKCSTDNEQQ